MSRRIDFNIDDLCRMYIEEDKDLRTIAELFNCSITTISRNLKFSGNEMVLKKLKFKNIWRINLKTLIEEYLSYGESSKTLAKKYNVDGVTIVKLLRKSGNVEVLNKLNKNRKEPLREKKKWSKITKINNESIGLTPHNSYNIFIIPAYLEEYIKNINWTEAKKKNKTSGYVNGTIHKGIICSLHHVIIGCPLNGYVVDHIDGNTLNNMPNNLRVVTTILNNHNQYSKSKNKYKGITKNKDGKWSAQIRMANMTFHLGKYTTQEEAGYIYLDFKANTIGFEYMPEREIKDYQYLFEYLSIGDTNETF